MSSKLVSTLNSRNFFVSLVSLVLLAFSANDLGITTTAGQLVETVASKNTGAIIALFFMNFLNPVLKLVGQGFKWSWDFVRSPNFWTQVLTTVLSAVSLVGIAFPAEAPTELVEAVQSKDFLTIYSAIGVNILNSLWHFFQKPKPQLPQLSQN